MEMNSISPNDIDLTTMQTNIGSIVGMIESGEIVLDYSFQRISTVWTEVNISRLIESILLQIPIPAFYFDASESAALEKWLVIDGLQRLSTFNQFILGSLKLSGLTVLTNLNSKTSKDLDVNLQRRIQRCQITTHLIKPGTPKMVCFDLFKRINMI